MDWSHRSNDTLFYKVPSGISDGNVTYGSLQTAASRIEEYPSVVKGMGGEEIVTSHRAANAVDIVTEARCWIDSSETGDNSKSLRILRKRKAATLDGGYTLYIYTLGR